MPGFLWRVFRVLPVSWSEEEAALRVCVAVLLGGRLQMGWPGRGVRSSTSGRGTRGSLLWGQGVVPSLCTWEGPVFFLFCILTRGQAMLKI